LFHPSGEVLAVVEAKKTSRDLREAQILSFIKSVRRPNPAKMQDSPRKPVR
jgi:hypothetical protein